MIWPGSGPAPGGDYQLLHGIRLLVNATRPARAPHSAGAAQYEARCEALAPASVITKRFPRSD